MTQEQKQPETMQQGDRIPLPNGKDVRFNLNPDQEPLETVDPTPVSSPDHIETVPIPPSPAALLQKLSEMEGGLAMAMDAVSQAHRAIGSIGDEITAIVNLLVQRGIFTVPDMKIAVANAQSRRRMLIQNMMRQKTGEQPAVQDVQAPPPADAPAQKEGSDHDQAG